MLLPVKAPRGGRGAEVLSNVATVLSLKTASRGGHREAGASTRVTYVPRCNLALRAY